MIKLKIILLLKLALQPQHVESFLLSHGIRARVQIVSLAEPLILGQQEQYFEQVKKAFIKNRKELVYVMTGTFNRGSDGFMLGYAHPALGISMGTWKDNEKGTDRVLHSLVIIAHEVGHLRGLLHDGVNECKSIMDANALACPNIASLSFTKQQLKRMK